MKNDNTNYLDLIKQIASLVNVSIELSNKEKGNETNSWERMISSHFFARICSMGHSLLYLLPETEQFKIIGNSIIDLHSISSITRSLIDTYLMWFYMTQNEQDRSKIEFKRIFWHYYSQHVQLDIGKIVKIDQSKLQPIEEDLKDIEDKIARNKYFLSLPDKQKKRFLKCEIFMIETNTEIALKAQINIEIYKSIYSILSRFVHSDSFCIDLMESFYDEHEKIFHFLNTILYHLIWFNSLSIKDFMRITSMQYDQLEYAIRIIIDDSIKYIKNSRFE